ncbi:hypothetical protein LTR22_027850, partial [Elasticomyces elasticus]
AGTILAYTGGCLPQWQEEKFGLRRLKYTELKKERKDVVLTEGNGAHDAILILGCENCIDLEALAAPQRSKSNEQFTRWSSGCLAILWIALLISVAGWDEYTWFLLGVGLLGALNNIFVAGIKRRPNASGFDLHYEATTVEGKVMEVLWEVETKHPRAGLAMLPVFFPGKLLPRERLLWEYAQWRSEQLQELGRETVLQQWAMPSLRRPENALDDVAFELGKAWREHRLGHLISVISSVVTRPAQQRITQPAWHPKVPPSLFISVELFHGSSEVSYLLRAEEGVGVLFFSPSKVQKARELQDAKEAAKEREALEKVSRTEARAALKAQKELEAQQKRKGRAIRAEARKAEEALKKTQREQAREARKAQKQLETESKAS